MVEVAALYKVGVFVPVALPVCGQGNGHGEGAVNVALRGNSKCVEF